jgi:hypothetical protein
MSARALTIKQSQCTGSADGTMATPMLDLAESSGMLAVAVKASRFAASSRCAPT